MTARSLTEAGGDSLESDPASRAPWPLPTHSIGETPTTGIMPPSITGPVTMPGPEPLTEVIAWVPVEQAKRPDSGETVALMFDDGSWIRGYCDEAGSTWYDADTCGQVSGFKWWARVKGPQ